MQLQKVIAHLSMEVNVVYDYDNNNNNNNNNNNKDDDDIDDDDNNCIPISKAKSEWSYLFACMSCM